MPLVKLNSGVTRQYSDRDAKLLVLVKKGVIIEDAPSNDQKPEYQTKVEKVEQTEGVESVKRAYKRKDIKAK